MRILLLLSVLFLLSCNKPQIKNDEPSSTPDYVLVAKEFIELIKKDNKKRIAEKVLYPIRRKAPLSDIENKKQFVKFFDELFEAELLEEIKQSDPNIDWDDVGSRGVMYKSGQLWLDFDGQLFAINAENKLAKTKRDKLIEEDKQQLHASLLDFAEPTLTFKTEKFLVRIDETDQGIYRYASWSSDKIMSDTPDLILQNGELIFEGSGGNHKYVFNNQAYVYECQVIILGSASSPLARLNVQKDGMVIMTEDALEFSN